MEARFPANYESATSTLSIDTPAPGIVVLTVSGHDIGQFGSEPIKRLESGLADDENFELYIDARRSQGVSVEVSSEWALWLGANQSRFERIHMLTGSRFIQITAEFVRRFSRLQGIMRIYSNADAFDEALTASIDGSRGR